MNDTKYQTFLKIMMCCVNRTRRSPYRTCINIITCIIGNMAFLESREHGGCETKTLLVLGKLNRTFIIWGYVQLCVCLYVTYVIQ